MTTHVRCNLPENAKYRVLMMTEIKVGGEWRSDPSSAVTSLVVNPGQVGEVTIWDTKRVIVEEIPL